MLHTPVPLPELWSTDLPWFFLAIYAPIVTAERVVMRCGEKMVSLRVEDGSIEWTTVVDPDEGNGALFLAHAGQYITEKARVPDLLATVLAVDASGQERWRTDLDAMLALGSAVVVDDRLLALSLGSKQETTLYQLDLATGAMREQHTLPWQADGLVPVPGGLVARNQEASGDAPGLYRMSQAGTEPTPMLQGPVRYLEGAGEHLLALSQAEAGAPCMVRVYGASGLDALWSAPARTEAAALDGGEVFHVADAPDGGASEHGVLVARDARTGAVRWRSEPLATKITAISVGGPVVLCNHRQGQVLYRRSDGGLIGTMRGSYGPPTVVGTRMYIGRPRALVCASVEAL